MYDNNIMLIKAIVNVLRNSGEARKFLPSIRNFFSANQNFQQWKEIHATQESREMRFMRCNTRTNFPQTAHIYLPARCSIKQNGLRKKSIYIMRAVINPLAFIPSFRGEKNRCTWLYRVGKCAKHWLELIKKRSVVIILFKKWGFTARMYEKLRFWTCVGKKRPFSL